MLILSRCGSSCAAWAAKHTPFGQRCPLFADALRLHSTFAAHADDFDPFRACVGNLILAGGYLHHKRVFGPVLAFTGRLLQTRGVVLPIVSESLHLAAELEDGSIVIGQHHF